MDKLIHILSIDIQNEMDIILAHRRGMQLARFSGVSLSEQTRFATAVSEISRNALEYAGHGVIKFEIILAHEQSLLTATVSLVLQVQNFNQATYCLIQSLYRAGKYTLINDGFITTWILFQVIGCHFQRA